MVHLHWLPQYPDFRSDIRSLPGDLTASQKIDHLRWLSGHNLNFTEILQLDRRLQAVLKSGSDIAGHLPTIKLAILSSSTVEHLQAAIRIGALRRGLNAQIYVAPYGQYRQEILASSSDLYTFAPDAVLLSIDSSQLQLPTSLELSWEDVEVAAEQQIAEWISYWQILINRLGTTVIQENFVPLSQKLFGHYDNSLPAVPNTFIRIVNDRLRRQTAQQHISMLDLESLAAAVGNQFWVDPTLWHHAKQAVSPVYSPLYGDHVGRLLGALRGLSAKCLVVDLDNTLWGGVIGDDGLGGIELGAGTATGEAFQAFQLYLKSLKQRGIILAVCSKNNYEVALEPFEHHPEMVLKLEDISVFLANWNDKATNLRNIAQHLNIGIDSLVFFDDNPAERAIVRQFLPEVAVPEVPDNPAYYIQCLSDAGYFEAVSYSKDDARRSEQYRANIQRQELQSQTQDINSFLNRLEMELTISPVDEVSLQRVTQLINRSNQFNLTTRRYTETQLQQYLSDSDTYCWQARLTDTFGDNGLISVVIAKSTKIEDSVGLYLDTWLMSCRVLGRQVEHAFTNFLVEQVNLQGKVFLLGEYIQTAKNGMVSDYYRQMGFHIFQENQKLESCRSLWKLDTATFEPMKTFIKTKVLVKS